MSRRPEGGSVVIDKHSERGVSAAGTPNMRPSLDSRENERLPFFPVPLNSFDLDVAIPVGSGPTSRISNFITYGIDVIDKRIKSCYEELPADVRPSPAFRDYTLHSASDGLSYRVAMSAVDWEPVPKFKEVFEKAQLGTASPFELTAMFLYKPEKIKSLEIAKYSTPFVWNENEPMDSMVWDVLNKSGFMAIGWPSRLYCVDSSAVVSGNTLRDSGAMTVLRKEYVATKPVDGGRVVAVRASSFDLDFSSQTLSSLQEDLERYEQARLNKKPQALERRLGGAFLSESDEILVINAIRKANSVDTRHGLQVTRYKTPLEVGEFDESCDYFCQEIQELVRGAIENARDKDFKPEHNAGVYPKGSYYYLYFDPLRR